VGIFNHGDQARFAGTLGTDKQVLLEDAAQQ
jgi:hypothetical protein